jgi:hypothetical protein
MAGWETVGPWKGLEGQVREESVGMLYNDANMQLLSRCQDVKMSS